MKLRNKKTGGIVVLQGELTYDDKVRLLTHDTSLAELSCEIKNDLDLLFLGGEE